MTEWDRKLLVYNLQWFAKDGPGGEKTEEPTSKRLDDARKDGKVAKSKELTAAFDLIVLFLVLKIFMSSVYDGFLGVFSFVYVRIPDFLENNSQYVSGRSIASFLFPVILDMGKIVLPFFLLGFAVCVLISILQVGWKVTAKPMEPKLDKFNPINGFKRIFSKDSLFELLKSIVKIGVIAYVAYTSVKANAEDLFVLYDIPLMQAVILVGEVILDAGLKIGIVYLVVGIADFIYQKHKFHEEMKMTKQEIKDEMKNTEGSPETKGRQRQAMREASRRRMMQDVPKADVIITNPTHLSVALKYDANESRAPIVLAKGEDHLAMKIREVAKENNIEIVENKPLARMLYANVDIGQEIPPELYQAVAEVLAMVYNLKNN
ncbi:MAG: flagellar biosynthesis protein FlhB [Lachnospiraceae bacterium]|nr:flagellar biosynthesis protein FlhB [Lachnospiraceae bacterium]